MSHETEDHLLTHGAARILNCTPDGVRYLERTGKLPAVRVNGVRVFRREDVEKLRRKRDEMRPSGVDCIRRGRDQRRPRE